MSDLFTKAVCMFGHPFYSLGNILNENWAVAVPSLITINAALLGILGISFSLILFAHQTLLGKAHSKIIETIRGQSRFQLSFAALFTLVVLLSVGLLLDRHSNDAAGLLVAANILIALSVACFLVRLFTKMLRYVDPIYHLKQFTRDITKGQITHNKSTNDETRKKAIKEWKETCNSSVTAMAYYVEQYSALHEHAVVTEALGRIADAHILFHTKNTDPNASIVTIKELLQLARRAISKRDDDTLISLINAHKRMALGLLTLAETSEETANNLPALIIVPDEIAIATLRNSQRHDSKVLDEYFGYVFWLSTMLVKHGISNILAHNRLHESLYKITLLALEAEDNPHTLFNIDMILRNAYPARWLNEFLSYIHSQNNLSTANLSALDQWLASLWITQEKQRNSEKIIESAIKYNSNSAIDIIEWTENLCRLSLPCAFQENCKGKLQKSLLLHIASVIGTIDPSYIQEEALVAQAISSLTQLAKTAILFNYFPIVIHAFISIQTFTIKGETPNAVKTGLISLATILSLPQLKEEDKGRLMARLPKEMSSDVLDQVSAKLKDGRWKNTLHGIDDTRKGAIEAELSVLIKKLAPKPKSP